MLNGSNLKGVTLLVKNKVKLLSDTPNFLFFKVGNQEVRYDKRKDLWNCTCLHEVWRGNKLNELCYHIKACKYYLRNKGEKND